MTWIMFNGNLLNTEKCLRFVKFTETNLNLDRKYQIHADLGGYDPIESFEREEDRDARFLELQKMLIR